MSITKDLVKGLFVKEAMNEQLVIVTKKAKNGDIDYQDFNVSSNGDFSTPKSLTDEIVSHMCINDGDACLDVSVGTDANFICSILENNKNINVWIADVSIINLILARKKIKDLFDIEIPDNQVILYNTFEDFNERTNNMNIDVIVGNPPYDDHSNSANNVKLWSKFAKKAIELRPKTIAFVTPNAAFKDVDSNGKETRKIMKSNGYGLVNFRDHKSTQFKEAIETCHWVISLETSTPIDSAIFDVLPAIEHDICNKVVNYDKKLKLVMENDKVKREDTSSEYGKYEILFSGSKISYTNNPVHSGGLKVVMPFSCTYKSMFMADKPTGMLNMVHYVDDVNEAEDVIKNSKHPLMVFVAAKWKRTSGFTPFVKNGMVPDLKGIDYDDIYDIFDITDEQQQYIKTFLKIK
jgi:hypothetical protein